LPGSSSEGRGDRGIIYYIRSRKGRQGIKNGTNVSQGRDLYSFYKKIAARIKGSMYGLPLKFSNPQTAKKGVSSLSVEQAMSRVAASTDFARRLPR
jgi:hypothetical protein